ncbi:MAG: ETC complex I subunit [Sphingomonadales bacterium]
MDAQILSPARSAMQSGQGKDGTWLLVFEPEAAKRPDPLMGWAGSGDMRSQVRIFFDTLAEAEVYAKRAGLEYRVMRPQKAKPSIRSYADNFK